MNAALRQKARVRVGTVDDSRAYQHLMGQGFSGNWFAERFQWQYFGKVSRATLFIAQIENEPVAMLGVELRRLNNGWLSATVIDVVVASGWRRRGLLRTLEDSASAFAHQSGAAVMTSLLNEAGRCALGRLAGWSMVCQIPRLVRPAGPFPAPSASSQEALPSTPVFQVERDEACRTWRYVEHPHHRYTLLRSQSGLAAAVKSFVDGSPVGDIVEVFGSNRDPAALEEIYRLAADHLAANGAVAVVTWGVLPKAEGKLLRYLGWKEAAQDRYLAVKALSPDATILYDREVWRLQPADIEHY